MSSSEFVVKSEIDFEIEAKTEENSQTSHHSGNIELRDLTTATTAQKHRTQRFFDNTDPEGSADDDLQLQNLLKSFNLDILYTTLKLGDISFRSLKYLSTEDINAVIRNIAYRAEFREKLFAWRRDKFGYNDTCVIPPSLQTTVSQSAPSTFTTTASGVGGPSLLVIPPVSAHVASAGESNLTGASAGTGVARRHTPEEFLSLLPGVEIDVEQALDLLPSTSTQTQTQAPPPINVPRSLSLNGGSAGGSGGGGGHLPKCDMVMSSFKVDVDNILESTHVGRSIKQFYDKTGHLDNKHRNEIVRLIIEDVMQHGDRLSPKDFRVIVNDIIKIFPNEEAAADYYYIYRGGRGNPIGRLYQRYTNENSKRRKLTRLAEDEDSLDEEQPPPSGHIEDDELMSNCEQDLPGTVPYVDEMTALALKQLLTTDHFSWEEVCDKWIQTWALRQKELKQSGLSELMANWTKLSDPRAAELFNIDFRHVFVNKENCLLHKWNDYTEKIKMHFDKKINYECIKKLYRYVKMGKTSKDEQDFVYAIGLAALLPPTARFRDHNGKLKIRPPLVTASIRL